VLAALWGLLLLEVLYWAWSVMWSGAALPTAFFGGDHAAYRNGALRLIETGSPYHAALHAGPIANVVENVPIGYLYPPFLAQAFVPLSAIPPFAVALASSVTQLVLLAICLPLVSRRYAGSRTITGLIAVWLATAVSYPIHMAAFGGNLSGWIAIGVAVMLLGPGPRAGATAAVLALVKMTPAVLLLPALLTGPRTRRAALAVSIAAIAASITVAPAAWADWINVLPNILRFPPPMEQMNLAPGAVLGSFGAGTLGSVIGLAVAAVAVVLAAGFAWRGRWSAAMAAAVAALLLGPNALWDHYLAMTLPVLIAAWPTAGRVARIGLGWLLAVHALHWFLVPPSPEVRLVYLLGILAGCAASVAVLARRAPELDAEAQPTLVIDLRPEFAPAVAGR
jgi:hypothetical protein